MKKICVFGAALAMFAAKTNAQVMDGAPKSERSVSAVHFGIEGGVNLNNLYKLEQDNYTKSDMLKVGAHGGFIANIGTGHLSLQPGLRYIMKGGELTSSSTTPRTRIETKDKLTFHYIEMPLNLVYSTGYWGESRFMIGAGPYGSILVNAQDKHKVKTTNLETGTDVVEQGQHSLAISKKDDGEIDRYDVGANAFIGYQGASGVYAKAGASIGLVDLMNGTNIGQYYNRNYNFLFSLGYMFGYKCK